MKFAAVAQKLAVATVVVIRNKECKELYEPLFSRSYESNSKRARETFKKN